MTNLRCTTLPRDPMRCTTLVIGDQRLKITAISHRLQQDVTRLQLRIATLSAQPAPNSLALQTYQDILDRRLTVLSWLRHYQPPTSGSAPHLQPGP